MFWKITHDELIIMLFLKPSLVLSGLLLLLIQYKWDFITYIHIIIYEHIYEQLLSIGIFNITLKYSALPTVQGLQICIQPSPSILI